MPKPVMNRPQKLTEAFIKQYCSLLRDGASNAVAASIMEISTQTIQNWLMSGEDPNHPCHQFRLKCLKATAENAQEAVNQWRTINKSTGDFRSLQNYLAVIHRMNAPSKVEITGSVQMSHSLEQPDLSKLSESELTAYIDRAEANERLLAQTTTMRLIESGEIIEAESEDLDD